jgi:hypothetical protein
VASLHTHRCICSCKAIAGVGALAVAARCSRTQQDAAERQDAVCRAPVAPLLPHAHSCVFKPCIPVTKACTPTPPGLHL